MTTFEAQVDAALSSAEESLFPHIYEIVRLIRENGGSTAVRMLVSTLDRILPLFRHDETTLEGEHAPVVRRKNIVLKPFPWREFCDVDLAEKPIMDLRLVFQHAADYIRFPRGDSYMGSYDESHPAFDGLRKALASFDTEHARLTAEGTRTTRALADCLVAIKTILRTALCNVLKDGKPAHQILQSAFRGAHGTFVNASGKPAYAYLCQSVLSKISALPKADKASSFTVKDITFTTSSTVVGEHVHAASTDAFFHRFFGTDSKTSAIVSAWGLTYNAEGTGANMSSCVLRATPSIVPRSGASAPSARASEIVVAAIAFGVAAAANAPSVIASTGAPFPDLSDILSCTTRPVSKDSFLTSASIMDAPIDPEVSRHIQAADPILLILNWISDLHNIQEHLHGLSKSGLISQNETSVRSSAVLRSGDVLDRFVLPLSQGQIAASFKTITAMVTLLRLNPKVTHRELLTAANPALAASLQGAGLGDSSSSDDTRLDTSTAVFELLDACKAESLTLDDVLSLVEKIVPHLPVCVTGTAWPTPFRNPELLMVAIKRAQGKDVLSFFASISDERAANGAYPIHQVVECATVNGIEIAAEQINSLIENGAQINSGDSQKCTPLDLAASAKHYSLVTLLSSKGAFGGMRTSMLETLARNLYAVPERTLQQDAALSAIENIMERNPKLKWELGFSEILPSSLPGAERVVQGEFWSDRCAPRSTWSQLFDDDNTMKFCDDKLGRSQVGVVTSGLHTFHFRPYPAFPGLERAVATLSRNLFGMWMAPFMELVRWSDGKPIVVSAAVMGQTLHEILNSNEETLDLLDPCGFSEAMVSALLTSPEAGTPDKYTMIEVQGERFRLVCHDNDICFVPGEARANAPSCKCVIFCMDQMNHLVHKSVRKAIQSLDIVEFIKSWVQSMGASVVAHQALFEDKAKDFAAQGTYVGIPLPSGTARQLCDKLFRMKIVVEERGEFLSHLDLLTAVEPALGVKYGAVLGKKEKVLTRFAEADGKLLHRASVQPAYFRSNFTGLKAYQALDPNCTDANILQILKGETCSPKQALLEVEEFEREYTFCRASHGNTFRKQLEVGDASAFGALKHGSLQEYILRYLDFAALPADKQALVANSASKSDLHVLVFANCAAMTLDLLKSKLHANITVIDLAGCKGMDMNSKSLTHIAKTCPSLQKLKIAGVSGMSSLKSASTVFPSLRVFNASKCADLEEVAFSAPLLRHLNMSECPKLSYLHIKSPLLKSLNLMDCKAFNADSLRDFAAASGATELQHVESSVLWSDVQRSLKPCNYVFFRDMWSRSNEPEVLERWFRAILDDTVGQQFISSSEAVVEETVAAAIQAMLSNLMHVGVQESARMLIDRFWPGDETPLPKDAGSSYERAVSAACIYLEKRMYDMGDKLKGERLYIILRCCLDQWPDRRGILQQTLHKMVHSMHNDNVTLDLRSQAAQFTLTLAQRFAQLASRYSFVSFCVGEIPNTKLLNTLIVRSNCKDPTLTSVELSRSGLKDDAMKALTDALLSSPLVTAIDLQGNLVGEGGIPVLDNWLKRSQSIVSVNLGRNRFGSDGVKSLVPSMRSHPSVMSLDVSECNIDQKGASALGEIVASNTTLSSLTVMGNQLRALGISRLARSFAPTSNLFYLHLGSNAVGDEGVAVLSEYLNNLCNLQHLDLSGNGITAVGILHLITPLKSNKVLTELVLSDNPIGDDGVALISEVLPTNTLRIVLLEKVGMGAHGPAAIARALTSCTSLLELDLRLNSIGADVSPLLQALVGNTTLEALHLRQVGLTADAMLEFSDVLCRNTGLKYIDLSFNSFGDTASDEFARALNSNTSLETIDCRATKVMRTHLFQNANCHIVFV